MSELPENRSLMLLSRKYSDYAITKNEFCEERRKLLDAIDASYNRKPSVVLEIASGIKTKYEDVINYLRSKI